jgi:crossover junction endodeoxyribonuclease RuvC
MGYGLIDLVGNTLRHVTHGTVRLSNTGGKAVIPLERRLLLVHEAISRVVKEFKPEVMAIEKVFFAKNAVSALKLGQARGAAILSGMIHSLSVVEYSASEVKQSVCGHGSADKEQVAKMVQLLFGKQDFATADASDGLAVAVCHAHNLRMLGTPKSALAQALQSQTGRRSKKKRSMAECVGHAVGANPGKK